jgi:hypothetical protein
MIQTTVLPARSRDAFYAEEFLENFLFSAWEGVAVSAQEMSFQLREAQQRLSGAADRVYMVREMMALCVEAIEMFGSAYLRFVKRRHRGPHQSTNRELRNLFDRTFEAEPLATFLRLPNGTGGDLRPVILKAGARAAVVANELARYWRERIQSVRWFRHLPLSISVSEVEEFTDVANPSFQDVMKQMKEQTDQLDAVLAIPDGDAIAYVPLYRGELDAALSATRYVIAMLFMVSGNQALDLDSPLPEHRLPKVSRLILNTLSPAEMEALEKSGDVFIVE